MSSAQCVTLVELPQLSIFLLASDNAYMRHLLRMVSSQTPEAASVPYSRAESATDLEVTATRQRKGGLWRAVSFLHVNVMCLNIKGFGLPT